MSVTSRNDLSSEPMVDRFLQAGVGKAQLDLGALVLLLRLLALDPHGLVDGW